MASPANFEVTRILGAGVHNSQFKFGKLYLRQIFSGADTNQSGVIVANTATGLGETSVNNWGIYDGLGSNATLVARAQGVHTFAANWQNWFTMVFEEQRFKGSTLSITGASFMEPDEWAIVGGTGKFAMALGVIQRKFYQDGAGERIHEISIDGYCRMNLQTVPTPTKSGPWGWGGSGSGTTLYELTEKSQRLVSLTIFFYNEIEGIRFSYLNEDGKLRTAGLWGRHFPHPSRVEKTIIFGPSEVVTGISGIVAYLNHVAQFKIVTNFTTYGPFGKHDAVPSNTPFSFSVPADKTVVGFFVNADANVRNIGVYTI